MRIRQFDYHRAESLHHALEFLDARGAETKVLAGGTDLVLALKGKTIAPTCVLDINELKDLDYIRPNGSELRIGPLVRHARMASDPFIQRKFPALACATGLIGSWQLRNVGTLGGNLCNASPSADSASVLLAADAVAVIADLNGEEQVPLRNFFTGPRTSQLKPNQILKEVVVPLRDARSHSVYLKLMRKKAVDLALVGVCFQAELDETGTRIAKVGIGLGGVAPTPIRVPSAEALFSGSGYQEALKALPEAAEAAVASAKPISDIRATADYRRDIVRVFVQRSGKQVFETLFSGVS
jgi:aerobic carbon-monoxide dehydrogenase medium subunit